MYKDCEYYSLSESRRSLGVIEYIDRDHHHYYHVRWTGDNDRNCYDERHIYLYKPCTNKEASLNLKR
jgi:hypothetical protein